MAVIDEQGLMEYTKKVKSAMTMVPLLTVTVVSGTEVVATCGTEIQRGISENNKVDLRLPAFGDWTIYGTKDGETTQSVVMPITVNARYTLNLYFGQIYGVEWAKTSEPRWARTDDAEFFVDPVPYVNSANSYGSPFDSLYPWAEMTIHNDAELGKLVKIPKYWFKWINTTSSLKLQISNHEEPGFHVSPAHAARYDGDIEKDYVYVGRYHCSSNFKSESGLIPVVNLTRSQARNSIHLKGSDVWQYDFSMYWTIVMLYLVEYGHFDCQTQIGYGCGDNSAKTVTGYTDGMPYHTGTMQGSRADYGFGTQYRNIEGLWDNCFDWCDGIYFNQRAMYVNNNPNQYSDNTGGIYIGDRPDENGYPIAYTTPLEEGYEYALFPSLLGDGSEGTYNCDYYYYAPTGVTLYVGGNFIQNRTRGLFYLNGENTAIENNNMIGCRLWKAGD